MPACPNPFACRCTPQATLHTPLLVASMLLCAAIWRVPPALADAIIQTEAMKAPTIAEYFVEADHVRLTLEVGLEQIELFRNLLPDDVYTRVTGETRPLAERLAEFLSNDLVLMGENDRILLGRLVAIEPRDRIRRDPITGAPVIDESAEPETVIRAEFEFPLDQLPEQLTVIKNQPASIGFVLYHQGVAVNDFRYLSQQQQVNLDWQDPWYTAFSSRALRRTYYAPMSGFLYIEPYEVRKEIIVRPKDLQQFTDLGIAGMNKIPIELQAELKRRAGEYLRQRQPVVIDGHSVEPELARVNFLERTLNTSQVIDPPRPLDVNAATLGLIFVYPTVEPLPQKVSMNWDLFIDKLPSVPAASVDQAGALPQTLTPEYPVLEWQNFLQNPQLPTLEIIAAPPTLLASLLYHGRWLLVIALLGAIGLAAGQIRGQRSISWRHATVVGLVGLTGAGLWLTQSQAPAVRNADDVVAGLLHNIYRAFDFRAEADVYDVLSQSVSGALLTEIYLETRRGLILENQGGARAKVKDITLVSLDTRTGEDGGIVADAAWEVLGSVGHWGHLHERRNRYLATLDIRPIDAEWKLVALQILEEERL